MRRHTWTASLTRASVLLLFSAPRFALAATPTAEYSVTFTASWSAQIHPTGFPASPHFSPLIGATHSGGVVFWEPGQDASSGIEQMAETGNTAGLSDEIAAVITVGNAQTSIIGSGIGLSPGEAQVSFDASQAYPLLTLVSMLAPSPDWFVGVRDLPLFDGANWVTLQVVALFVYDAGTDSGATYTSADADTDPQDPIAIKSDSPFDNGVQVGTFTIQRTNAPVAIPGLNPVAIGLLALLIGGTTWWKSRRVVVSSSSEGPAGR